MHRDSISRQHRSLRVVLAPRRAGCEQGRRRRDRRPTLLHNRAGTLERWGADQCLADISLQALHWALGIYTAMHPGKNRSLTASSRALVSIFKERPKFPKVPPPSSPRQRQVLRVQEHESPTTSLRRRGTLAGEHPLRQLRLTARARAGAGRRRASAA
eukprot:scaffold37565_cov74-Phaeocystis_antarctica.AAC.3